MIEHRNSRGQVCTGCSCEYDAPMNTGGIVLVGDCAMRFPHGTFKFDDETGECTKWPVCCAEHVHTGPDEPDGYCSAHGVTKPEHTVLLTATGPILPLDEPEMRLSIVAIEPPKPNDPYLVATLADERKVAIPTHLALRDPKWNEPMAGEITVRGYHMLRSGSLIPTVGRQFAQKRIDALFGRIQRAAYEHTFTWKEREVIRQAQDPQQAAGRMVRDKGRAMGVSLSADMDAGRIDITITAQALIINPHNPEDGGREFHHVEPVEAEIAVVHPLLRTPSPKLALVS